VFERPADPVHGDRERLVRLARERAERHRPRREALDDLARRLDLVERDAAVAANLNSSRPRSDAAPRDGSFISRAHSS
jgi:hypothetical protein